MKYVLSAAALLSFAGCTEYGVSRISTADNDKSTAIALVKETLRNPQSAQFRAVQSYQIENGQRAICLEYNAENAFGGMAGFQPFSVTFLPDGSTYVQADLLAANYCNTLATGKARI